MVGLLVGEVAGVEQHAGSVMRARGVGQRIERIVGGRAKGLFMFSLLGLAGLRLVAFGALALRGFEGVRMGVTTGVTGGLTTSVTTGVTGGRVTGGITGGRVTGGRGGSTTSTRETTTSTTSGVLWRPSLVTTASWKRWVPIARPASTVTTASAVLTVRPLTKVVIASAPGAQGWPM